MSDTTPKRRAPAFQFYADDFLAGTLELSQAEVGAYIRLLCHQWNRGSIPVEPEKQQRLAGGSVSVDVLAKFRLHDDGTLKNDRLESVRAASDAFRDKQAEKGRKSAEKRANMVNRGSTVVQPDSQPDSQPDANSPSPSPSPLIPPNPQGGIEQTLKLENEPAPKPRDPMEGFSLFWQAYPKKQGRTPAEKAWRKLQPDAETVRRIVEHVQVRRTSEDWTKDLGQFIPLPSTFLNQKRWTDETRVDVKPTATSKSATTEDRLVAQSGVTL